MKMVEDLKEFDRMWIEETRYQIEQKALRLEEQRNCDVIYNEIASEPEEIRDEEPKKESMEEPEIKEEGVEENNEEIRVTGIIDDRKIREHQKVLETLKSSRIVGLLEGLRKDYELKEAEKDQPLSNHHEEPHYEGCQYHQKPYLIKNTGEKKAKEAFELLLRGDDDSDDTSSEAMEIEDKKAEDIRSEAEALRVEREKMAKKIEARTKELEVIGELEYDEENQEDQKEQERMIHLKKQKTLLISPTGIVRPTRLYNEYARAEHLDFKAEMDKYSSFVERPWIDSLSRLYRSMIAYLQRVIHDAKRLKKRVTFVPCCTLIWIGPKPPHTTHVGLGEDKIRESKRFKKLMNRRKINQDVYDEAMLDMIKAKRAREIESKVGKGAGGFMIPLYDINSVEDLEIYMNDAKDIARPGIQMFFDEEEHRLAQFLVKVSSEKRKYYWGYGARRKGIKCFVPLPLIVRTKTGHVEERLALECFFSQNPNPKTEREKEEIIWKKSKNKIEFNSKKEYAYCMKK